MENLTIRKVSGDEAKALVTPLYVSEGNGIEVRPTDLFFVGLVGGETVAAVRFCIEEQTPMLRTMRVAKRVQRTGLGHQVLAAFEEYLEANAIRGVYCLPFTHLETFYGAIGFKTVAIETAPVFLQERLRGYLLKGMSAICMARP